eukprot:CAMPEP_0173469238 /NCGR_PEP_ID=MMETSP1357-20121228/77257_1 /TAXON_ID=77926 /ORGANISM="Hemiselmis rufescens, Strain PCC563" /LENGTH=131 /DNA_ID=CAMNT_0014437475 /DNA_START=518 /DNA_END=914 /DNA_ORIENTATION=-
MQPMPPAPPTVMEAQNGKAKEEDGWTVTERNGWTIMEKGMTVKRYKGCWSQWTYACWGSNWALFSVLAQSGVFALLSVNALFSILSLNCLFSIQASTPASLSSVTVPYLQSGALANHSRYAFEALSGAFDG